MDSKLCSTCGMGAGWHSLECPRGRGPELTQPGPHADELPPAGTYNPMLSLIGGTLELMLKEACWQPSQSVRGAREYTFQACCHEYKLHVIYDSVINGWKLALFEHNTTRKMID